MPSAFDALAAPASPIEPKGAVPPSAVTVTTAASCVRPTSGVPPLTQMPSGSCDVGKRARKIGVASSGDASPPSLGAPAPPSALPAAPALPAVPAPALPPDAGGGGDVSSPPHACANARAPSATVDIPSVQERKVIVSSSDSLTGIAHLCAVVVGRSAERDRPQVFP